VNTSRVHMPVGMLVLVLACGVSTAVTIETVPVGNPGNPDDTHAVGYRAVDYPYDIGKYELTAGQYTAFLNAVAATDTYELYDTYTWTYPKGCRIQRSGAPGSRSYTVAAAWAGRLVYRIN